MSEPDLRALQIFRAVALEGSVSRAAARLHRVQSNVSTRIKQLEAHYDRKLFLRGSRGLTLTSDGELLLTYAEKLLELSAAASEALKGRRPGGRFRIGTMESTAAARLPAVLSRYHREHPQVEIEVRTDTAGALLRGLLAREIDVALVAEPVAFAQLETRPVFVEALVLVVPRSFPTLGDAAAISGRTVIAFEQGCAYRRYLEDWLLERGIVPGTTLSVGSYLAMLACVAAGTGFAVVPRSVLDALSSGGAYRCEPLAGKLAAIRTLLAWRPDYRSANLEALIELLPAHSDANSRSSGSAVNDSTKN